VASHSLFLYYVPPDWYTLVPHFAIHKINAHIAVKQILTCYVLPLSSEPNFPVYIYQSPCLVVFSRRTEFTYYPSNSRVSSIYMGEATPACVRCTNSNSSIGRLTTCIGTYPSTWAFRWIFSLLYVVLFDTNFFILYPTFHLLFIYLSSINLKCVSLITASVLNGKRTTLRL